MHSWLYGRYTLPGLIVAVIAAAIDQGHKYWMLHVYDIANNPDITLTPFLQLVMVWNRGISYGLFQQGTAAGMIFLISFRIIAIVIMIVWLARVHTRIGALAIGLLVGGAAGNAIDGILYGAVADFFLFHIGSFSWYVFNLADCAVVAGVMLLMYDILRNKVPEAGTQESEPR